LSALLVAVFEFSLGVWLIVKGFNPDAVVALESTRPPADREPEPVTVLPER
jgi:hypothetical protein